MQTKTEILTRGTWTMVYYGYDDDFNWIIDNYENLMYSCEQDDIWSFNPNNELTEDEGPVRCGAATGFSFNWQLSSQDNNQIMIDDRTYIIKTLDNYTLEVYIEYRSANGPERYIKKWVRNA